MTSSYNQVDEYFKFKCWKGLKSLELDNKQEYRDRLTYELDVIIPMGFAGYFLIVQHILNWARDNNVYIGFGRGSVAGSLASYCLNITGLDPIRWGLYFERFINPDRISMPDIDSDIEDRYRDKVVQYVKDWLGEDRVANIGTFGHLKAKAAVLAAQRTLGLPYAVGNELSKLLLGNIHGKPQKLTDSINKISELEKVHKSKTEKGDVLRWAEKIEGFVADNGTHASGYVISNESLLNSVPLFVDKDGRHVSQWGMDSIEDVGLIKYDFLGLDALTKLHICTDLVNRNGTTFNSFKIPLDDEQTFENLRQGDNIGIFQLGASGGMKDLLIKMRPTCIEDLSMLVAIYRPGPLQSKSLQDYLAVRAGLQKPHYLVPELEPILSPTGSMMIYQEQSMTIAKELCGYTGAESDSLRKAIGKKKQDLMDQHEKKFKAGWVKNGLLEDKGNQLWDDINACASYQFNASHSYSYGLLTYQTAYCKTHYPTEYMCACLITKSDDKDEVIKLLSECKRLGINIMPPDINKSQLSFTITDPQTIEFGLGPIKNIGEASIKKVLEERDRRPFVSLRDFCERVDLGLVNRSKLDSLISAGAFDCFGYTRRAMLESVQAIWDYRTENKKYEKKLETYRKRLDAYIEREEEIKEGKLNKRGQKLNPKKLPEKPEEPQWPAIIEYDEMSLQELLKLEHELLGFYVTSHPLKGKKSNRTIEWAKEELGDKERVELTLVLIKKNEITTKTRKEKMAFLQLEDLTGTIEGVIFASTYRKYGDLLVEGDIVDLQATVEVTETEETKISKLNIWKVSKHVIQGPSEGEILSLSVRLENLPGFLDILKKYQGDTHTIRAIFESQDGTRWLAPTRYKVGSFKNTILREVAHLNEQNTDTIGSRNSDR